MSMFIPAPTTPTSPVAKKKQPMIPPPKLSNLIFQLTKEFEMKNGETVEPEELKEIMKNLGGQDLTLKDLNVYALFDSNKRYTRNLIWGNQYFSLILLCWNPKEESCIHAHGGSQCWARVVQGELTEVVYNSDPDMDMKSLDPTEVNTLHSGEATYIDDGLGVHKLVNHLSDPSVSLHLYAPPYAKCAYFNPQTGKRLVAEISFHSEYGVLNKPSAETASLCCTQKN